MIVYQSRIYRVDLRANPNVLYVFGDNCARTGLGGQAGEMRGEPNAVGVVTKVWPGSVVAAYFSDDDYENVKWLIQRDAEPIRAHHVQGGVVVVPLDGIGTGLSELPTRAPRIYAYICALGLGAQNDS